MEATMAHSEQLHARYICNFIIMMKKWETRTAGAYFLQSLYMPDTLADDILHK